MWATGNGGLTFDDCNADGYVSSVETLAVGSISDDGKMPYFMEECTSTIAVVPTGGQKEKPTENIQNQRVRVVSLTQFYINFFILFIFFLYIYIFLNLFIYMSKKNNFCNYFLLKFFLLVRYQPEISKTFHLAHTYVIEKTVFWYL